MILLFIVTCILYLLLTYLVLSLYYRYRKDIEELEKQLSVLEKRIEEFKKDYKGIYIPVDEEMSILLPLCEIDKFDMEKVNYYLGQFGKPKLKIKNIKEVSDMACKKGRGGRKK